LHEVWARFFASSLEDRLRYTPSDCFETFPFPVDFEPSGRSAEDAGSVDHGTPEPSRPGEALAPPSLPVAKSQSLPAPIPKSQGPPVTKSQSPPNPLEAVGRTYYEFRAALMQDLWLGLTEIYNLFHSPDDEALARLESLYRKRAANCEWRTAEKVPSDRSPFTIYRSPTAALEGVRRLRELHAAMDAAVLTAYGWTDLLPRCQCEFLLDYEEDDSETVGPGDVATSSASQGPLVTKSPSRRKKPWRYRWPDDVRDEVLARLLKLNAERAEEERIAGLGQTAGPGDSGTRRQKTSKSPRHPGSKSAVNSTQGHLIPPPQSDLFG